MLKQNSRSIQSLMIVGTSVGMGFGAVLISNTWQAVIVGWIVGGILGYFNRNL